ncbi:MAG: hypothetical protein M0P00_10160 [Bacteroidaceae bacterium]|nr:hypothetical protein [Bacteroidaceae bacterium]
MAAPLAGGVESFGWLVGEGFPGLGTTAGRYRSPDCSGGCAGSGLQEHPGPQGQSPFLPLPAPGG